MLMRYAQHLADGHGIVWNIGEHPVDGATDFLFMVASAAFIKLGLTVGQSVRGIGFASHLLTVLIVYWTNRRVNNANIPFFFIKRTLSRRWDWTLLRVCLLWDAFLCPRRRIHLDFGPDPDSKRESTLWVDPRLRPERTRHWADSPEGVILASLMLLAVYHVCEDLRIHFDHCYLWRSLSFAWRRILFVEMELLRLSIAQSVLQKR